MLVAEQIFMSDKSGRSGGKKQHTNIKENLNQKQMKFSRSTILFLIPSTALLLAGIFFATSLYRFYEMPRFISILNIPSLAIIIGGVWSHVLISYPTQEVWRALSKLALLFSHNRTNRADLREEIPTVISWQREVRKNKLAAAASYSEELKDTFEGYVFTLMATNYTLDELKALGETRIVSNFQNNSRDSQLYATMGNASPAFGMFGTLLGLIIMLQNFDDSLQLGTGLGVALMTTLYGLTLAQLLWYPMERKIKNAAEQTARREKMILEGILLVMQDKPAMYIKDYLLASIE